MVKYGLKINDVNDLCDLERYAYIYFGSEFCERKIPSFDFCRQVFIFCIKNNKTPVVLTPYLSELYLENYFILIKKLLAEFDCNFEITINDFGLLNKLSSSSLNLSGVRFNLGRLQIKMKKGPEVMTCVSKNSLNKYKSNSLNNDKFISLMNSRGISRFEIDIPSQGLNLPFINSGDDESGSCVTLYLGNYVINTTRRCPFINSGHDDYSYSIESCSRECFSSYLVKNTKYYDELIYVLGNAEFVKTKNLIDDDLKNKFDRVVIFKKMTDLL